MNELAAIQENPTIGRRSGSKWFGKPIVGLPKHHTETIDTDAGFLATILPLLQ